MLLMSLERVSFSKIITCFFYTLMGCHFIISRALGTQWKDKGERAAAPFFFCFRPHEKNLRSPFAASGKSSTFAGKIRTTTTRHDRVVSLLYIA